jgi:hypothetical protein
VWWTAADARAATADPSWPDGLVDVPIVVIDLRVDDGREPPAVHRAPCPVIALVSGESPPEWPVDLTLADGSDDTALFGDTVEGVARALAERAAANPMAAATLARVLRVTAALDVAAALEVESLAYSMLLAGPEFRRWLAARPRPRPRADEGDVVRTARDGRVSEA